MNWLTLTHSEMTWCPVLRFSSIFCQEVILKGSKFMKDVTRFSRAEVKKSKNKDCIMSFILSASQVVEAIL